ncbi:MAG TPA: MFS transporter, partial [Rhodopila sp.]|nr:MFS transporter [Rhodopila sp.]
MGALDALNFLLADVRGALGPYLNVFLVTQRHWSQSQVGLVTTVAGILGLLVQTPVGAAIDATRAKRALIVGSLLLLAGGAVVIFALPFFWPVMLANAVVAAVGDVFGPAVAALTLGLFAASQLARRLGRNAAFDHAGNVAIAIAAGAVGWVFGQRAVFLLVPVFAVAAVMACLAIPAAAIDHKRARGGGAEASGDSARGLGVLLSCRPLLIYGVCTLLFHFANAPLLPLVGQKLAIGHPALATMMMSSCIVAAQLIMLPIALAVGRYADRAGRKPILLIGFGILPLRAVLYTVSDAAPWLIGVQILDGVGAGIWGTITPLVVADLMRGTGRFNVSQAAIMTMQGVGASLSGLAAGEVVDRWGYAVA